MEKEYNTEFAPAERTSGEILLKQSEFLSGNPLIKDLYNAVTEIVVILNKERQVVYYNKNLISFLEIDNDQIICGLRPGEVLNCVHAFETEGGCGTTEFCKTCGAVNAILKSQGGLTDIQECRIMQKDSGDALDIKVKATPLNLNGEEFTIFTVIDISDEKRRKVLERIFFHDILNTAGSVRSLSELLFNATNDEVELFRGMVYKGADKLIDEINSQRDLTAAENNELKLNLSIVNSLNIISGTRELYLNHEVAKGKDIELAGHSDPVDMSTDRALLSRVVGNMLKNALEASSRGEKITLGCMLKENNVVFWVHNPGFIPRDTQLQIFNRSFSTKGVNRGLGTYSMKLLTERFLKGKVEFTTDPETGTIFKAIIPILLD